jgi:hypothetical protein
MERLLGLGLLVEPLRQLTDPAQHVEMDAMVLSPLQFAALDRSRYAHPEEKWACIQFSNETYMCVDEVSRHVGGANNSAAVVFPPLHMHLVSWWLMHAWRHVELTKMCTLSLVDWNLNVAAILARSVIEGVGCLLFEAKAISDCWAKLKQLPAPNRPGAVYSQLHPLLVKFRLGSRELGLPGGVDATNVLTYVDKLKKQCGLQELREQYNWLSNAAHPAIGSRIAYMGPTTGHVSGAVAQWDVLRRPASVQGQRKELQFTLAHIAADALISVAPIGCALLWQCLLIVDDFGLTSNAYRLTDRQYWRKLRKKFPRMPLRLWEGGPKASQVGKSSPVNNGST